MTVGSEWYASATSMLYPSLVVYIVVFRMLLLSSLFLLCEYTSDGTTV